MGIKPIPALVLAPHSVLTDLRLSTPYLYSKQGMESPRPSTKQPLFNQFHPRESIHQLKKIAKYVYFNGKLYGLNLLGIKNPNNKNMLLN